MPNLPLQIQTTRLRAATWHLLISGAVALMAAGVVFGLWFPGAYRDMAGGYKLFLVLTSVDVALGPLLTLVVFNPRKTRRHLAMDLGVVSLLQIAALIYGLYSVALSRPVVLAAENALFRVVPYSDVKHDELHRAQPGLRALSWAGPRLVGIRQVKDSQEMTDAIDWALRGYDAGTRPPRWVPYEQAANRVLAQALAISALPQKEAWQQQALRDAVNGTALKPAQLKAMPVMARQSGWFVLLDAKAGMPQGFVRLEREHD